MDKAGITLSLADGTGWVLHAADPGAESILSLLQGAMQLRPDPGTCPGHDLLLAVCDRKDIEPRIVPVSPELDRPLACVLSAPENRDLLAIQAMIVGLAVFREALSRGAVLLHGALAAFPCPAETLDMPAGHERFGVILAGPGTVGKSTASMRLPQPWLSLCDDTTLVIPDAEGRYWAHPWPTWSRFYDNGLGHSVDMQSAVPLAAIFFLTRSAGDRATRLKTASAAALLMTSSQQASGGLRRGLAEEEVRTLHAAQFAAVDMLSRAIPANRLEISLTGAFWKEIERAVLEAPSGSGVRATKRTDAPDGSNIAPRRSRPRTLPGEDGPARFLLIRPTRRVEIRSIETLEVVPYVRGAARPGDLICCRRRGQARFAVQRVLAASNGSALVCADGGPLCDSRRVPISEIAGRVVAVEQAGRRETVAGGRRGQVDSVVRRLSRVGGNLLDGLDRAMTWASVIGGRAAGPMGLRVMLFHGFPWPQLKLMAGARVVGVYDVIGKQWRLRRPFHILMPTSELDRRAGAALRLFPAVSSLNQPRQRSPRDALHGGVLDEKGESMLDQGFQSPVSPSFIPVPNPSAVFREALDDWAVLVDMDSSAALSLNPTGALVWKLIDGKRSVSWIADALRREVDEAPENVLDDVLACVEVLVKEGMVGYEVE